MRKLKKTTRIDLILFPSAEKALASLIFGKVDVFVNELGATGFLIDKLGYSNLKVVPSTEYTFNLRVGVRKDWPELRSILNKILDSTTPEMAGRSTKRN